MSKDFHGLPVLCAADLSYNNIASMTIDLVSNTRCSNHGVVGKLEIILQGNTFLFITSWKFFKIISKTQFRKSRFVWRKLADACWNVWDVLRSIDGNCPLHCPAIVANRHWPAINSDSGPVNGTSCKHYEAKSTNSVRRKPNAIDCSNHCPSYVAPTYSGHRNFEPYWRHHNIDDGCSWNHCWRFG